MLWLGQRNKPIVVGLLFEVENRVTKLKNLLQPLPSSQRQDGPAQLTVRCSASYSALSVLGGNLNAGSLASRAKQSRMVANVASAPR